jgi:two-component system response regulator YesN
MHKVLIADDDILFRIGLRMMIDWEGNGWEIIGEASNGVQAMEAVKSLTPDLLIVDMKMPHMDGAEVLQQLREQNANVKIIVLSSYDDYSYMRTALTKGAHDYLLKSELSRELLVSALDKARQAILEEEQRNKEYSRLKHQAEHSQYIAYESFFKSMIRRENPGRQEIMAEIKRYDIALHDPCFSVAVFSCDPSFLDDPSYGPEKSEAILLSLFTIIQGTLRELPHAFVFRHEFPGCFVAVVNHRGDDVVIDKMEKLAAKAIEAAKLYTHVKMTAGIGGASAALAELHGEYARAMEALKHRLLSDDAVINGRKLPAEDGQLRDYLKEFQTLYDDLLDELTKGSPESGETELLRLLEWIRERKSMRLLIAFCNELASWYNKELGHAHMDGLTTGSPAYLHAEELLSCGSYRQLASRFMARYGELRQAAIPIRFKNLSLEIRKAAEYIHLHCDRDISLSEVASSVGMSKSHFSVVFREQTGINFVEYVTHVRVELAKRLLRNMNLKIYEVALKAGFDNERYFSRVFRNKVGLTPTEYRKQVGGAGP